VDEVAPRPVSAQGGRPPYPTETMVRILVLKRLYNLSDEQMEYPLLEKDGTSRERRTVGLAPERSVAVSRHRSPALKGQDRGQHRHPR